MTEPEPHRSLRLLHLVGRVYPNAWSIHNAFRSERSSEWPEHVFAPRQAARLAATGRADVQYVYEQGARMRLVGIGDPEVAESMRHAMAVAFIGAMAAWRPTQGIYRFADALLDALWVTPVAGDLPGELLRRLPEWCVYIEIGRSCAGMFIHGAWVRVGYDLNTREEALDILIDSDPDKPLVRLPLVGTLQESLRVSLDDGLHMAGRDLVARALHDHAHRVRATWAEPLLSVVLYLCSVNAEIRSSDGRDRPIRPEPHVRRNRERVWPAAPAPVIWETGTRLGSALRRAESATRDRPSDTGDGPAVRPHIRRAHWHTFWVGAHDSRERHREVRWLPPIPVNVDEDEGPGVATIRPIPEDA